jgi:CheY-like chemotaxis protein
MFQKEWPVLIVDDEPDVLEVTRLVLKDVRVDGRPLKIQTARSKAEAVQLLLASPGPPTAPTFAVALIDVVMETDQAGLELVEFLRENLKNKATQIYVRTGQAGIAPERAVVDRFDINGYFTKVEATEDKLYSMVKAGVRQHEFLANSQILSRILTGSIGRTRAGIDQLMQGFGVFLRQNGASVGIVVGHEVLTAIDMQPDEVLSECRRLDAQAGTPMADQGDKMVADGTTVLFKATAGPFNDEAYLLYQGVGSSNAPLRMLHAAFLRGLATLVKATAPTAAIV